MTGRFPRISKRLLADPGVQAIAVLGILVVAGFVMLGVAWSGAAATPYVPLQLPWFVSGSLLGLAVIGMALGGWSIHLGRRQDALHRDEIETLVHEAVELAEAVRTGRCRRPQCDGPLLCRQHHAEQAGAIETGGRPAMRGRG